MSSENELKEGNIQQPEENEGSGEIEGYSYCKCYDYHFGLADYGSIYGVIVSIYLK